ncbi:methionine--tRNA ligase, partial [Patescibacteria group bacterium]
PSTSSGQEKRQVIAGIADKFSEKDLKNKLFPFVFNMEPAQIRGHESQAMILVAEDESENLALLEPSTDIKPGSKIV